MKWKILIIGCAILIFLGSLFAQEEIFPVAQRGYFSSGLGFQMWRIKGVYHSKNQLAFPLTVLLPFGEHFNLAIQHTPAFSWWFGEYRMNGISDTWVRGNLVFLGEKAMLNLGLGIPTGKTRLNIAQFDLARDLGRNIFRFRSPVYGQGPCARGGLAFAFQLTEKVVLGFGGQYLYRMGYHPIEFEYGSEIGIPEKTWSKEYVPGDEVSGQVGFDFRIDENTKIMLDGIYTYYWKDFLDNEVVYRAGDKFTFNFALFHRSYQHYLWSHVTFRQRAKNEVIRELSFQEQDKNSNGYQIEIDMIYKIMEIMRSELFILGEGRYYGQNGRRVEEATGTSKMEYGDEMVVGLGVGTNYRLSENSLLDFQMKYLMGNFKYETNNWILGLDTFLGLKIEF